jgi:small acid-soluble spore protein (thioredoxin-like protein)
MINREEKNKDKRRSSKPKPDDRSDNVERIQKNIDYTIHNIELAEELIGKTDDEKMKEDLTEKNERREEALEGMKKEIKDEADAREKREQEEGNDEEESSEENSDDEEDSEENSEEE